MLHDLHFLILTCLHKIQSFSLVLSSEAFSIDELGLIGPHLHTYTTFFLLKFIFHKKLQMIVGYRFFFLSSIDEVQHGVECMLSLWPVLSRSVIVVQ